VTDAVGQSGSVLQTKAIMDVLRRNNMHSVEDVANSTPECKRPVLKAIEMLLQLGDGPLWEVHAAAAQQILRDISYSARVTAHHSARSGMTFLRDMGAEQPRVKEYHVTE